MPSRAPDPASLVAALAGTRTASVCLLFPFVLWTFFPLCASWICTFMECDAFYQVLSHPLLRHSSKVILICLFYRWGNWGPERLSILSMVPGIRPHCSGSSPKPLFNNKQRYGPVVTDVVPSSEGHSWIWVPLAPGNLAVFGWLESKSEFNSKRRKGSVLCALYRYPLLLTWVLQNSNFYVGLDRAFDTAEKLLKP